MQHTGLFPHYNVAENIAVVPNLLKWGKDKTQERITELIEKLRLPAECLNMFPHQLSGGQQQRVGLARALVASPSVLLMDEPFGALDNVTRSSIQEEFKALEELRSTTILMVTHDVDEAFELADRICLMDRGEIIQIGTPKDLLYNPVNDFARKFLDGQRLRLEFKVTRIKDLWDFLPEETGKEEKTCAAECNLWSALESLRSGSMARITFISDDNGTSRKSAGFQELTQAFHSYQSLQSHE